jgi:hypothetical protein
MKTTKEKKSGKGFYGPAALWAAAAALASVVILAGCKNSDGGDDGGGNNGDTTAPVLSEQSVTDYADTSDGTTATVNFTSDEAGSYWVVVYASDTAAPADGAALYAGYANASVKATGNATANTVVNANITGLTRDTAYKAHVTVKDAAGNYSAVWTSEAFTPTADTTAPVLSEQSVTDYADTADGTTATVNFTSDEAGTYYVVVYLSGAAAPADGAAVEAAYNGGVTGNVKAAATGSAAADTAVSVNITSLTAYTAHTAYVAVKDAVDNYAFTRLYYRGPAGGLIFYVSSDGFSSKSVTCHYLEAAPVDLGTCQWGGYGTSCSTGTNIGTGATNTAALATHDHGMPSLGSGLHLAAQACAEYAVGIYSDWFLPSKNELGLMYTNLKAQGLGGFSNSWYWSSSESSDNDAWMQYFGSGLSTIASKDNTCSVRAVRAF